MKKKETLEFIQTMLAEMRQMSRSEGCDMLTYFIEQACIEVKDMLSGERPYNTRLGVKLTVAVDEHDKHEITKARPAA